MGTLPQEVTQPLTAKRKYPEKRKKRGKTRLLTLKHTQKAKNNKFHLGNSTKKPHGASQGGQQQGDAVKQPEQLAQGWLFFLGRITGSPGAFSTRHPHVKQELLPLPFG